MISFLSVYVHCISTCHLVPPAQCIVQEALSDILSFCLGTKTPDFADWFKCFSPDQYWCALYITRPYYILRIMYYVERNVFMNVLISSFIGRQEKTCFPFAATDDPEALVNICHKYKYSSRSSLLFGYINIQCK